MSGAFDLITCIHSFEHMYRPLDALRKLRTLIANDGALFIRCPDSRVPGVERDYVDPLYATHPFVHTLSSVVRACAETGTFRVDWEQALVPGQRDIILRPLPVKPG